MRPGLRAILTCCTVALAATTALAGKVTRLQIELPPNIRAFEPGQRVDTVQVVGIDADGQRVGLGGATPVLTATTGRVETIQAPYRFAYTAPAQIAGPLRLSLEAHLPDAPGVKGSLEIEVLPPGPYVLLRIDATPERVDWGGSLELRVRGETRDGRVVPVADRRIEVSTDGPGTIEFTRLGHYRYRAPAAPGKDGRATVSIRARFEKDAAVNGELNITLGSQSSKGKPPHADESPSATEEASESGSRPAEAPPVGVPPATPPATTDGASETPKPADAQDKSVAPVTTEPETGTPETGRKHAPESVLWSGGRLRLTAWRVRAADAGEQSARRVARLPEAGDTFASREPIQRLRFTVEDATVSEVTADACHGSADGERAVDAVDVQVKRNKAGQLTVILEARPQDDGTELHVTLTLARAVGDPSLDVIVLKTRKAKNASE